MALHDVCPLRRGSAHVPAGDEAVLLGAMQAGGGSGTATGCRLRDLWRLRQQPA
jgi:hypothetical protein